MNIQEYIKVIHRVLKTIILVLIIVFYPYFVFVISEVITNYNTSVLVNNQESKINSAVIDIKNINDNISFKKLENDNIEYLYIDDENYNDKYLTYILNEINLINDYNENILKSFNKNKWKIVLSSNQSYFENTSNDNSIIIANTVYNKKTIYINTNQFIIGAVLHELWHYYEYQNYIDNRYFFYNTDFANYCFKEEFYILKEEFQVNNVDLKNEYFCEAFRIYIFNKELFKQKCPLTYIFFELYK